MLNARKLLSWPVFITIFLTQVNRYYRLAAKAILCTGFVLVLLGFNAYEASAQNTKGDRPEVRSGGKRENRFKPLRKKNKSKSSYNRVKPRRYSPASSARLSKPTKANRNFYNNRSSYNNRSVSDRASRQNTRSGKSFNNNRSVSDRVSGQNTRSGKSLSNNRSISGNVSKRNARSGGRITPRSNSGRANFYSQRKFINNRSTLQSRSSRNKIVSNRSQIARSKRFGTKQNPPSGRGYAAPRSASRPFISRKSTTPFAGFWNRKPKGEKPYTKGDLAGRPLRTKNFETRNPKLSNPTANPYRVKHTRGDRPYKGPIRGGYVSGSTSGKPWRGDIAGRKIKGRNYSSKRPPIGGKRIHPPPRSISGRAGSNKGSLSGGGYRSISGSMQRGGGGAKARSLGKGSWNNNGRPISGRNAGANGGLGLYSGNMKPRKGYSVQGETYTGNIKVRKGYSPQGETYTGSMKARRRAKGGGSISGAWNNNGRAISGKNAGANGNLGFYSGNMKPRKGYAVQGETYTGNIKARRREKGGGSISGSWNNNGRAIAGRNAGANGNLGFYSGNMKPRKGYSPQGETYTGNIKAKKREKGGGSISGSWNNNGRAIPGRNAGGDQAVSWFQGNVKFKRKEKGGGSVSGKFWNNNEQSTTVGNTNSTKMAAFQGKMKAKKNEKKDVDYFPGKYKQFDLHPSMRDQGEEYTGNIKLSRFKKNYIKNPNQADEALKKDRPDKTTYLVNGLQIKVKEKEYKKRPHGADGSMPGIAPGKNSIRASEYSRAIRLRWDYKRNPSSATGALKVREPGKAFVQATNYQGNIKMKRFDLFRKKDFYPDSRFVKTNKNNTDEERGVLTNFKLWWARLFKKNETQPDHLKEKIKKPRYDKGEQGLWYD